MLCSVKQLSSFELIARDGDIGKVREVYFDDDRWVVRHLVVGTGGWLSGRDVLISPHAVQRLDSGGHRIELALTRRQIEEAPGVDTDKPVSRQHEVPLYDYYGYPYYWTGGGMWGLAAYPLGGVAWERPKDPATPPETSPAEAGDPHLRSSNEVSGYRIEASDGEIGHVDDFLFDERSWQIRYAVVDTRNWLPGRHVLVSPDWIAGVDWSDRRVRVTITCEAVKSSPEYEPQALTRDDEERLLRHFGHT